MPSPPTPLPVQTVEAKVVDCIGQIGKKNLSKEQNVSQELLHTSTPSSYHISSLPSPQAAIIISGKVGLELSQHHMHHLT